MLLGETLVCLPSHTKFALAAFKLLEKSEASD